jgi:hypothetical protein
MPKTKRYPWPASALTDADLMAQLHQVSLATKKPITVLIREATDRLVAELRDKMDDPASLRGAA